MAQHSVVPGGVITITVTSIDQFGVSQPFSLDAVPTPTFTLLSQDGSTVIFDHQPGVRDITSPVDPLALVKTLAYRIPTSVVGGSYVGLFNIFSAGANLTATTAITVQTSTGTLDALILELQRRKFPQVLTQDDYQGVVTAALRDLQRYMPVTSYGRFTTVRGQTDYNIFDPLDPITLGFAAEAVEVRAVMWNPGEVGITADLFSAGWLLSDQGLLDLSANFSQPSNLMLFRQQVDAWKRQFGGQGYEIIGDMGDPAAVLRIAPVPQQDGTVVVVEITSPSLLSNVNSQKYQWLMQWVEYRTAEAITNEYATTAGIELLGFSDSKEAMKYWERRMDRLEQKALDAQAGLHGEVGRS